MWGAEKKNSKDPEGHLYDLDHCCTHTPSGSLCTCRSSGLKNESLADKSHSTCYVDRDQHKQPPVDVLEI